MTFEEFATARLRELLRTARAICGDRTLAEDLVQDVLLKAQRHWDRIRTLDAPDAYLRRMLVNEFVSARRRAGRVHLAAEIEPADLSPDHATQHADRDALRIEIARLPRKQQVVLALRYYAGLSDSEIAHALGCRPGTVRGYASRALASLRVTGGANLLGVEGSAR